MIMDSQYSPYFPMGMTANTTFGRSVPISPSVGGAVTPDECEMLEKARRARVETQYYTTRSVSETFSATLSKRVPRFLVTCRSVVDGLDEKQVQKLREMLTRLIDESRNHQ